VLRPRTLPKAMQRLFTTFPSGWPGAGLLLLRVVSAVPSILDGVGILSGGSEPITAWIKVVSLLSAAPLLVGMWTPLAALSQVITEGLLTISAPSIANLHLTRAAIALAVVALGPGAWSVDARLYGRKRIDI